MSPPCSGSTAEDETGHARGHLEYIEEMDAQAAGKPIGPTGDNLKAAIASETHEYTDVYPGHGARGPPGATPKPKGRRRALFPRYGLAGQL